jgi:very-long-chain ceramide synthase
MSKSPHWFDTTHLWIGYPHVEMSKFFKLYYLLQLAFSFQQVLAINIGKRDDYIEMFPHHVIAALFTGCTYLMNLTRIGNAILCTMDVSDIVLPVSQFNSISLFKTYFYFSNLFFF